MGLPKGRTNNPHGRNPGSLNKIGKDLRTNISDFLNARFDEFVIIYDSMDDKDKANIYIELIPFVVPKMQASALTVDIENSCKSISELFPSEDELGNVTST
jgi:hypothetical protein